LLTNLFVLIRFQFSFILLDIFQFLSSYFHIFFVFFRIIAQNKAWKIIQDFQYWF